MGGGGGGRRAIPAASGVQRTPGIGFLTNSVTGTDTERVQSVRIINPKDREKVSGKIVIKVKIDVGLIRPEAEVHINGTYIGTIRERRGSTLYDTTEKRNGDYTLIAKASNSAGNKVEHAIRIKIANPIH